MTQPVFMCESGWVSVTDHRMVASVVTCVAFLTSIQRFIAQIRAPTLIIVWRKGTGDDAETTPESRLPTMDKFGPVIGRGRPMGRPRSSVVVLVFVPKYAPRWEALLLLFNTTRARAHSPHSGPLSTDHSAEE